MVEGLVQCCFSRPSVHDSSVHDPSDAGMERRARGPGHSAGRGAGGPSSGPPWCNGNLTQQPKFSLAAACAACSHAPFSPRGVVAVGACTPNHREIDTECVTSCKVYVDTMAACIKEPGDIVIYFLKNAKRRLTLLPPPPPLRAPPAPSPCVRPPCAHHA